MPPKFGGTSVVIFKKPNEAVEKPHKGANKIFFGGHSPHPNVMIVDCSALYEVDFSSSRFRFFEIEFFYSVNVEVRGYARV